jgi:hypothetical protein
LTDPSASGGKGKASSALAVAAPGAVHRSLKEKASKKKAKKDKQKPTAVPVPEVPRLQHTSKQQIFEFCK